MWDLKQAADAIGAGLIGQNQPWCGLEMDSRQLVHPAVFVALPGAKSDGHAFLPMAKLRGASGAIVAADQLDGLQAEDLPLLVVDSPFAAMQSLGIAVRESFQGPVVGITGSCGKTTTKELVAAALQPLGEVCASRGNYNNHLGVPLTLAGIPEGKVGVVEIGASAPGEVARLASWTRPGIAVITSIGEAHVQGFGSVEGVARAKSEILDGLDDDGVAVLPADTPFVPWLSHRAGDRSIRWFGRAAGSDARIREVDTADDLRCRAEIEIEDRVVQVLLRLTGPQSALAAAAALLVARELGVDLEQAAAAMGEVRGGPGRMQAMPMRGGGVLIDDSYNANPMSVANALEVLAARPGTRVAVLGEMAELGPLAEKRHGAAGRLAKKLGLDHLIAVGGGLAREMAESFGGGHHLADHQEAARLALELAGGKGGTALVKGSRSSRMELVVELLRAEGEGKGP